MRSILLVLLVGIAIPALAYIDDVSYAPEQPEVGDALWVHVVGYLSDSCWSLAAISQEVDGQEIRVFIDLVDAWEPGFECLTVITEYDEFFVFDDLAAGSYVLVVTERHESLRVPDDQVVTLPVEITGSVATEAATWTAIKSLYR